ncbi:TPA: S8 family peptidase [Clostridium perfringens]
MVNKNLPVKIILQRNDDIRPNIGRGSNKMFCEVNEALQDEIISKLNNLSDYYDKVYSSEENLPCIGKIKMKKKAIAKSHKPDRFSKNMPIIGSEELDEIYFKFTKDGIKNTINEVLLLPSEQFKSNLTAIEDIVPYYDDEKISKSLKEITTENFNRVKDKIKIKLFDFGSDFDNNKIYNHVIKRLKDLKVDNKLIKYGEKIEYLQLKLQNYNQVTEISKINGIKKIDFFCEYYGANEPIIKENLNIQIDNEKEDSDVIIGIIDSGISDDNLALKDYIYLREKYVADEYINPSHGTFVASTIQYGDRLNDIDNRNNKMFKFLDVVALPNSDENYGLIDSVSEDELMEIIDDVVSKHSDKVKIWNLSLGNESKICDGSISDLAIFCDFIQDKYNVQFFISSGNKNSLPLREWPSQITDDSDRIISPADSVRAVTVGSIALTESTDSLVKKDEPSPFSRRGPGASYIVKPDVVDYGGNCTNYGTCCDIGIKGLDPLGNLVECIGTSFSTPRVVKKFASILDEMNDKDLLLAKALLIHSAKINTGAIQNKDDIKYYGFGMPHNDVNDILRCNEHEITLVFKQKISNGSHLELMDFPFPESLIKDGKYYGEIFMTLVYNPPLDQAYGREYCRSNIDVGFGPYKYKENGGISFSSAVPIEKNWESRYEAEQVENGFKWSPVKSYYRKIKTGLNLADGWKLRIDMHERYKERVLSQEFILIITIRDLDKKYDIYSDVITGLRANGYIMTDIEVKNQIRNRN